jgi:hypothetical membrane protein
MNEIRQLLRKNTTNLSGLLLFITGIIIFMGIITAESMYPVDKSYTTREDEISDLAATKPPNSIITQPSAIIFNTTMICSGILILCATWLYYTSFQKILLSTAFGLLGMSVL